MSISKDSLCHPMDSTPSEYQRFLPGAYANYTDQAKRDQELFARRFPINKAQTTYLTHPQPVRTTDYLDNEKNKSLPSSRRYYREDNRLIDGPEPKNEPWRSCESRPARVVTVNSEKVDRNAHRFHPGQGHYQGFKTNIDNDTRLRNIDTPATLCPEKLLTPVFPGQSMESLHPVPEGMTKIWNGKSMGAATGNNGRMILNTGLCSSKMNIGQDNCDCEDDSEPITIGEGHEQQCVCSSSGGGGNSGVNKNKKIEGNCCHKGGTGNISHCQEKIGLPNCDGPLLQTNISSGARTDRYLQNNNPGAYHRREEHSFHWREFSQPEGQYRPEIKARTTRAETSVALPFQLECTRVKGVQESLQQPCHHLFNNMTKRKNLFQS